MYITIQGTLEYVNTLCPLCCSLELLKLMRYENALWRGVALYAFEKTTFRSNDFELLLLTMLALRIKTSNLFILKMPLHLLYFLII